VTLTRHLTDVDPCTEPALMIRHAAVSPYALRFQLRPPRRIAPSKTTSWLADRHGLYRVVEFNITKIPRRELLQIV